MWIGSNTSIHAVPCGVSSTFVQVGVVAVAGADGRDVLVGGVVDHVLALRRSRPRGSVPATRSARACLRTAGPGSWSPTRRREAGETTRGCRSVRRSSARASPRPGRARGTGRRARAGLGGRGDRHRRGRQRRRRAVVLDGARIARVDRELLLADRRLMGDREGRARRACRAAGVHARVDASRARRRGTGAPAGSSRPSRSSRRAARRRGCRCASRRRARRTPACPRRRGS